MNFVRLQNVASRNEAFSVSLIFSIIWTYFGEFFYGIGEMFIVVNGQILNK